jgi:hypothetical protein
MQQNKKYTHFKAGSQVYSFFKNFYSSFRKKFLSQPLQLKISQQIQYTFNCQSTNYRQCVPRTTKRPSGAKPVTVKRPAKSFVIQQAPTKMIQ